jgi:hypothetical protein
VKKEKKRKKDTAIKKATIVALVSFPTLWWRPSRGHQIFLFFGYNTPFLSKNSDFRSLQQMVTSAALWWVDSKREMVM